MRAFGFFAVFLYHNHIPEEYTLAYIFFIFFIIFFVAWILCKHDVKAQGLCHTHPHALVLPLCTNGVLGLTTTSNIL